MNLDKKLGIANPSGETIQSAMGERSEAVPATGEPPVGTASPDLATAILKQLTRLYAGSCSCGVKSPDIQWHDAGCRYRLAEEIRENVDALEAQRADQWRLRRDADSSRDASSAAADRLRSELEQVKAENEMPTDRERIIAAAVRQYGLTISLPPPARHHTILHPLNAWTDVIVGPFDQGFLTDKGRFVTRIEAAQLAVEAGQIQRPQHGDELYSEDLW